jgi:hypothetical protein
MPAIVIDTDDKDLADKTFRDLIKYCGFDYLPERIYVVTDRNLEFLTERGYPIRVLSDEEVKKSVADFKKKRGLA